MNKRQLLNYLLCTLLFISAAFVFLSFFVTDAFVLEFKLTGLAVLYSAFLFPAFSFVYGVVSYLLTRKIVIPNVIYVLFCAVFIILFVKIGGVYVSNYDVESLSVQQYDFLQQLKLALGIVNIVTAVSMIVSGVISVITSFVTSKIVKHVAFNTKTDSVNNSDNSEIE